MDGAVPDGVPVEGFWADGVCAQTGAAIATAAAKLPERDQVLVLLSFKAGLRAKEIAGLRWSMVTDSNGQLADQFALPDRASKGRNGGRVIPMHGDLREALAMLMLAEPDKVRPNRPVIYSERGNGYSANAVAVWFHNRYRELG